MTQQTQIKPENIRHNDLSSNLGKDEAIVVDGAGNIISRADRKTLERDYVGYQIFGSSDLGGKAAASKTVSAEGATAVATTPNPGVPTTPGGLPISDALADDPTPEAGTRTHPLDDGTPFEGPAAVEGQDLARNAQKVAGDTASGTPIKDALAASQDANTKAENAGRHAKPDELGGAQAKALDDEVPPAKDPDRPAKKDPLDHDGDSRKGGSKPGAESTASKGKENRQRKPNNDE